MVLPPPSAVPQDEESIRRSSPFSYPFSLAGAPQVVTGGAAHSTRAARTAIFNAALFLPRVMRVLPRIGSCVRSNVRAVTVCSTDKHRHRFAFHYGWASKFLVAFFA